MTTQEAIASSINGIAQFLPDQLLQNLSQAIDDVTQQIDAVYTNSRKDSIFKNPGSTDKNSDPDVYVNLQKMLNGDQKVTNEFTNILSQLYSKNRQYYNTLRDYEIMPILIPQINRVLTFLVNETISPDIQNTRTFELKYIGGGEKSSQIQQEIDEIRDEMRLDRRLVEIITNRFKLGRDYYMVADYNTTFDTMTGMIKERMLNEGYSIDSCINALDTLRGKMTETISEASATIPYTTYRENDIVQSKKTITCEDLNIVIERSPVVGMLESVQQELLDEKYKSYSVRTLLGKMSGNGFMNEAVTDEDSLSRMQKIIDAMRKKKVKRCTIERLDPARVFPLRLRGNLIGYFYLTDLAIEGSQGQYISGFGQALKDRLMKSRSTADPQTAATEENISRVISKTIAERIIKTFDPNIGIDRIEDIDLLHSFIMDNEIYNGNKKLVFYYKDDIFDMSRADESLLINAVFFTKLYAMLTMNNIMTKVLRGRGRQIHTVRMGASNSARRYIENALITLNNAESNLGMVHGSFEQLVNPLWSATDIIIPTEEGAEPFITTDYIEGQNVDMDTEFLKFLLSSIVSAFGLDSAVLDATNGNIQFAKTLATENLQIGNIIKNEQTDVHDPFEKFCLRILYIMGGDDLKGAIDGNQVEMCFYVPKVLMMQNSLDEINNAKNYAEGIADFIPEFNIDNANNTKRDVFVYMMIKEHVNLDWTKIDQMLKEAEIISNDVAIEGQIYTKMAEYIENTEARRYDEPSPEEAAAEDPYGDGGDLDDEEAGGFGEGLEEEEPAEEGEEETPEETPEEGEGVEEPETSEEGEEEPAEEGEEEPTEEGETEE